MEPVGRPDRRVDNKIWLKVRAERMPVGTEPTVFGKK